MLLKKHLAFQAGSIAELEHILTTVASGKVMSASPLQAQQSFRCHNIGRGACELFYLTSNLSSHFEFEPVDYLRFVFQIDGNYQVRIGATEKESKRIQTGYVMPPGLCASEIHPKGYKSLALRVNQDALRSRLITILDEYTASDVVFDMDAVEHDQFVKFVRQPLFTFAREVDHIPSPYLEFFLNDMSERILTSLIFHGQHNFKSRLISQAPHSGFKNLARVEEYIHANWQRGITLDILTDVAQVSGKTLCQSFIKKHGVSPSNYIKNIRLEKAHSMLISGTSQSVISVALVCGFSSMGHFSRAYRQKFGELPSMTKKKK